MLEESDSDQPKGLSDKEISGLINEAWKSRLVDIPNESDVLLATVSFAPFYREAPTRIKEYLSEKLRGKPLIDLGSGPHPDSTAKYFIKTFGVSKYVGVDIELINRKTNIKGISVEFFDSEALDFISKYEEEANVMSNGFLCSDLVGDKSVYGKTYYDRIFTHIKRVLPQDGIFFATHFDLNETAQKKGLKVDNEIKPRGEKYWRFISYKK